MAAVISNLECGLIAEILVRGGMDVKPGELLLKLNPTQTRAGLGSNSAATASLSAKIARLDAELDGRERVYPAGADAGQVRIERALHDAHMAELASLLAGAGARQAQAGRAVMEAQSMLAARQPGREAAASELKMMRRLVERGIEPRLALIWAQNAPRISASEALAQTEALGRARVTAAEATAEANRVRQEWRARAATEFVGVQPELPARTPQPLR